MKNRAVRTILLFVAAAVFLFSGAKVFKYRMELHSGEEFAETMVKAVVSPNTIQSADKIALEAVDDDQAPSTNADDKRYDSPEILVEEEIRVDAGAEASNQSNFNESVPLDSPDETVGTTCTDAPAETEKPSDVQAESLSEPVQKIPTRVAPINVDFETLLETNKDVVGWLYCPDTPINYPVVQGEDNDYYMHRLLDGSRSYPGTLFVDYRNSGDFADWNTLIYGHNMRNDSMFGTLPDFKMRSYREKHPEIFLLTPDQDYVIKLLTGLVVPDNDELYSALRPDDARKDSLLKTWLKDLDTVVYPSSEDRLVTLSTCSYEYNNARYVLIGVLEELAPLRASVESETESDV